MKFVPKCPINNISALVQIMAWRRPGVKPLSEPMMVRLPTHICGTRPQWVNSHSSSLRISAATMMLDSWTSTGLTFEVVIDRRPLTDCLTTAFVIFNFTVFFVIFLLLQLILPLLLTIVVIVIIFIILIILLLLIIITILVVIIFLPIFTTIIIIITILVVIILLPIITTIIIIIIIIITILVVIIFLPIITTIVIMITMNIISINLIKIYFNLVIWSEEEPFAVNPDVWTTALI